MRDTIFELPVYFPSWLNILPADGNERQLANGGKNKIINKYPVIFMIASCARSRGRVMFSRAKYSYLIVALLISNVYHLSGYVIPWNVML